MPGKHAKLSASGAHRWMACTPSASLEEQFPESTSEYAEEGTFAHALADLIINYNLHNITKAQFNKKFEKMKENQYFSQELLEYVEGYANQIFEFTNEAKLLCDDVIVLTEQRLDFSAYVPEGFGTGDVVIIADKELHIVDLKYGKGVGVNAEGNPQIRLYGLGALEAFGMLYDIDRIRMTICQPRLDMMTSETLTVNELQEWAEKEVRPRAELAMAGEGEFVVGDHCRFCKAKATCRARAEYNLELTKMEFAVPELLSDEEIGEILRKADQLANWVTDITEYALEEALKGKKWDGWKLVEGRSNRKYLDEIKVADTLKSAGYDEAVIYEKKLYGITAMEKIVGKKKFGELLNDLIIKPQGKPTLVPESDKRPEYSSADNAAKDFAEENTKLQECINELRMLEIIPPHRPISDYLKEWGNKYPAEVIKNAYAFVINNNMRE